jgi:hypothetical protein
MTNLVDYLAWEAMMMWMNLIADCPVVWKKTRVVVKILNINS